MLKVDKNSCVGCGLCVSVCSGALKLDVEKGFAEVTDAESSCVNKAIRVCPQNAIKEISERLVFAVGTDDNKTVKSNDHVGMSRFFQIFEYNAGDLVLKETRDNPKYREDETRIHGDPGKAKATASVLTDVDVLVGKMFGPNIVRLRKQFVCAVIREPDIEEAKKIIKDNICEISAQNNREDKPERMGIILK
ncbi:MAG: NifB/NifX family molybdenum-iron cluster-binding protein [Elusimicrobiota bacterium]|nr:NifB/NifX family molybdenum-iron cluster-binding protein [Elusimicrobiota bacterium]